jgi:hypothetical protein
MTPDWMTPSYHMAHGAMDSGFRHGLGQNPPRNGPVQCLSDPLTTDFGAPVGQQARSDPFKWPSTEELRIIAESLKLPPPPVEPNEFNYAQYAQSLGL